MRNVSSIIFANFFKPLSLVCVGIFISSCAQSPSGSVTSLGPNLKRPTFDGSFSKSFTTASSQYALQGECDPLSESLESSVDQTVWTELTDGCAESKFALTLKVDPAVKIYVRAKSKTQYTKASDAYVRYLLPPTSLMTEFVQSSASGLHGIKTSQNNIGQNFSTAPLIGTSRKIYSGVLGAVYEK